MDFNREYLYKLFESVNKCNVDKIHDPIIYCEKERLIPKGKSGIHIKKENRGKFTEAAKQAGKSVQEHAIDVLNDPNATPLQKKRANFARNAKKFNHK